MAVILRLRRHGANNNPTYRIVATDRRFPRDGRFIEVLGHYDPKRGGLETVKLDPERVRHWLDNGAIVSEIVQKILKKYGIKKTQPAREKKAKKEKIVKTATVKKAPSAAQKIAKKSVKKKE